MQSDTFLDHLDDPLDSLPTDPRSSKSSERVEDKSSLEDDSLAQLTLRRLKDYLRESLSDPSGEVLRNRRCHREAA
jgi:hypothetical protein